MPSAAYIKAASEAHREPVVLMAVESVEAIKRSISSQADWLSCEVDGVLDRDSVPGRVILRHELSLVKESLPWRGGISPPAPVAAFIHPGVVATISWQHDSQQSFALRLALRKNNLSGELLGYTDYVTISGVVVFSRGGVNTYHATALFPVSAPVSISQGQVVHVHPDRDAFDILESGSLQLVTTTASVTTPPIDLGGAPTQAALVGVDSFVPHASTSVIVTAFGRNTTGGSWTSLGAVTDGANIAPYRYYYFVAVLSSPNGIAGVSLREISVQGGDSQYLYFSTHQDEPVAGAKPYLVPGGVSSVGGKIELMKPATIGEVTLRLFWTQAVGDLIATGFLKNKAVLLKHGFVGLAESDYEPLLVGKWYDYDADHAKREISIKVRSAIQSLKRLKIPEETVDSAGNKSTTPLEVSGHIIDAILALYNLSGVRGRYIDSGAFHALRDGTLAGGQWHISRTLTKPEEAEKLINELAVTAGLMLVPLPDGRITPIIYDPQAEAVAMLDARAMDFGRISGGQKELFTQQIIYYEPTSAEPGESESDYARAIIYLNQTAADAWDEKNQQRWHDKWRADASALHALAARMDQWFANPRATIKVDKVPPRFMGLAQGQIVSVDNLPLPVTAAGWPGLSEGRKFLITARDFDPTRSTLSLTLLDTGEIGEPGSGVIGTDMVISGPQKPFGASNSYTVAGGSGPYTWATTLGQLSSTAGTTVNLNVSGLSGQGVLSVTDAGGTVTLRIEILPPQVVGLSHLHAATGTLLRWTPAQDWVQEYELRKGGTSWETSTFVARLRHTEINVGLLALGSHTYRLRGIDQWGNPSGQDAVHTLTIQAPSILSVNHSVIDNNVNLYWLSIPGNYPIASYRIYKGATWGTAEFIATADGTFHARFEKEAGVFTYWVQPLDLAGNFGAYGFSSANVSAPPDYIFFDNQAIDFAAATRSNLILDSGLLVGPATHTLGWDAHLAAHSFATPQAQIDGGYPYFAQPTPASGYVESVIDFGATIPASLVTLEISWRTVAGAVTLTPALQVASDPAGPWTDLGETWEARAEGFRYVKARVTLTGANETALAEVSDISVLLDVKEKNDAVAYVADAADTDGTWVAFSKTFIDIISIVPVAAHQSGIDGIIAQVRFVDEPNPTGFYVYHFRRDTGARISGAGSATIRGV